MRNLLPGLFPYNLKQRSTDLAAYQRQARRRPVLWLLVLVLLLHIGNVVRLTQRDSDPEVTTWSATRTADVDLSAAIYADDWPGWARWLTEIDSEEEALRWMAAEFKLLEEENLLEKEGLETAELISDLVQGEVTPRSDEYWQRKFRGGIWAWERIAARRQYGDNPPDWMVVEQGHYWNYNKRKAIQKAAASLVWWLVLVLGLPFLPAALRCFQVKNHHRLSPATRAWEPSMVTVRYILSGFLIMFLLRYYYPLLPDSFWLDHYYATLIFSDALWRTGGPIILGTLLFVRWRHAGRLLKLHVAPVIKPVLGMMSLASLYNYGLYLFTDKLTSFSNLDELSYEREGIWGFLFVIISGAILAPIFEEVVFRGILFQSYLRKFGFWLAMLFSTLLFVVVHFYEVHDSLSVAFFGIAACALYRATGSLWTAILFHVITNGLIFCTRWPIYYGI